MPTIPKGLGTIEKLEQRYKKAKMTFELWRDLHQEAMDYCTPQRETFTVHSEGERKNRFVFDSTAEEGVNQFASRIQGSLVPSWQQWMSLTAGDEIPENNQEEVDKALKETTDTFFSNLNHSNFDTEITPALHDLSIGTGAILVEENDFNETSAFVFTNIPLAELSIEKPARGAIKSSWRDQKVQVGNIMQTWPDAELTRELKQMMEKDPTTQIDIRNGFLFNAETKKYNQIVLYKKTVLFTQEFNEKRLIVFRWSVTPNESYGRGPAISKLPDIRSANKTTELIIGNAALQMSGMYTGRSDGIFNPHTVRIAPGSIIPVASNDNSNPTIRDLTPSGNIGVGEVMLEKFQNNIRKAFFSDPLGELTDPVRSATENILRNQEFLKNAGASIGRLKSELIEPLVAACIDILKERGKIPDIKVDGREVTIRQESPLAKSEGIESFQNTQLWLGTMAQYIPPEVLALKVKVEELPKKFQEQLGTDPTLIRSEQETAETAQKVQDAASQTLEGGLNAQQSV